jgi:hypothetical protein
MEICCEYDIYSKVSSGLLTHIVHLKSNETNFKICSEEEFVVKIILNIHHEPLYAYYTFLVMVESILEIPRNLSPRRGYLHSFECFEWYEILSLSASFLFLERKQCQIW